MVTVCVDVVEGIGEFTVYVGDTPGERRERARQDTMEERRNMALQLLQCAMSADNHWLAGDYIDAASAIWGKSFDKEFDKLCAEAGRRMRKMGDSEREANKIRSRESAR